MKRTRGGDDDADGGGLCRPYLPYTVGFHCGRADEDAAAAPAAAGLPAYWRRRLDTDAARHWDRFYAAHGTRAYRDRHWLAREFAAELLASPGAAPRLLLEVGAGAGNTLWPLLAADPALTAVAVDFAPVAVAQLRAAAAARGLAPRVRAEVADASAPGALRAALAADGPPALVTLMFVLGAMGEARIAAALAAVRDVLAPRGVVLFRDHAAGDLAQARRPAAARFADNHAVRGDGTQSYFFSLDAARSLFAAAGFDAASLRLVEREVRNEKLGLVMRRRFVQGALRVADAC